MSLEETVRLALAQKKPLGISISDADLKAVLNRFITPEGQNTQPDPLSGNNAGFGDLDTLERIIRDDPALTAKEEALAVADVLIYPGVKAMALHRIAHELFTSDDPANKAKALAIAKEAKQMTGIDIHPGATIGKRLFIDHGSSTVIGEQAIIGDDVKLYQQVTIGGDDKPRAN